MNTELVPAAYPLRDRPIWTRSLWPWAALLGGSSLVLYLATLAPAVGWWDSGELLACAKTLSVAHRPGFPLYVITGHVVFGWLSDPRWLANALSSVMAAFSLVCTWRAFCLLSGDRPANRVWAALGGLLVAASPMFWRQAIRIEVYAPVYACLSCALLLAAAAQKAPDPPSALRRFLLATYLLALAFCLHSAVTVPVAVAIGTLFLWGNFRPSMKHWIWAALCFASGLSIYLYVPLRAPWAPYVWGQPDQWSGFLSYFSAADAHGIIAQEAGGTLARAGELCQVVAAQASPLLIAIGIVGLLVGLFRRDGWGTSPLWLVVCALCVAASVVSYVIPNNADMHAYLVPLLWALWWGWTRLDPHRISGWYRIRWPRATPVVAALVLLAVFGLQAKQSMGEVDHTQLALSDRWGTDLLQNAHDGDLVIIHDVNTDFLLRGLSQSCPQAEITVLNAGLAESPWYRTWWESRHGLVASDAAHWTREIAEAWCRRGGRVLLDYGTPGFLPTEMTPLGMLCLWDTSRLPAKSLSELPQLRIEGSESDPEWVRSAVWFYYRLSLHERARGDMQAALRACDEGLAWSPDEEALHKQRSELTDSGELLSTAAPESGTTN